MNELEYIENYFANALSPREREAFEEKCEGDPVFAEEVAFYILSRQALHETSLEEKKSAFLEQFRQRANETGGARTSTQRWIYYVSAIAASVLLLIVFLVRSPNDRPEHLADAYISSNLSSLSTTMSATGDSLAMGVTAYNSREFETASNIFRLLERKEDVGVKATEYLGISYLASGKYDEAVAQFEKMIGFTDLHANPGKFYLAITLMKRSEPGDEERAKALLNEVVSRKLPGYREASVWIDDW